MGVRSCYICSPRDYSEISCEQQLDNPGFLILSLLRKLECFKHAHVGIRRRVVCFENHAEWRICLLSVQWQAPVETGLSVSRDRRTSCAVLRAVAQYALVERSFPFVFSSQLWSSIFCHCAVDLLCDAHDAHSAMAQENCPCHHSTNHVITQLLTKRFPSKKPTWKIIA